MLFMSFPPAPAVQPWTCHPPDHHFTQHLTRREKKGSGKKVTEKERDEA